MGNVWVKEFTGGLDARRMDETTAGGVLVVASNGHVTRGGEFEKRAAFVPEYALPVGTVGMAQGKASVYVFGSGAAPVVPSGITYQRLQHPDSVTDLTAILSADLYAGLLYVVGEFADGGVYHYYDGARVTDWYDGRARASFDVTGGSVAAAVAATGYFEVTGGVGGDTITGITINGVNLINAPVAWVTSNTVTAAAIATAINGYSSSPDYTAVAAGVGVTITAVTPGSTINGRSIVRTVTGTFATGNALVMNGGADTITSTLADLMVDGVSITGAPVPWAVSNEATASDIATTINAFSSAPEYTAVATGAQVSIVATLAGSAANGRAVAFTLQDGFTVDPAATTLLGGSETVNTYQPGTFVKTIGKKVYSVSGPNMHFSGIAAPTKWTTDAVGAGFIDMSSETSGAEELIALAKYQQYVAVFAERVIQTWYVDPDPALYRQVQVLNNTGTISPQSVTQFGDSDLFYLDESGLRSLRARDASNAASTNDIGVPVDPLIIAKLAAIDIDERRDIIGLIEPRDGRFWLIVKDTIFVFSFFNGAKVSAWSTYDASVTDANGVTTVFDVSNAIVYKRRVYLRSGDTIYVYGGLPATIEYDGTIAEAWLPYLDANAPTKSKTFTGIDAAVRGEWSVALAMDPTDTNAEDHVATVTETTYNSPRIGSLGKSTHVSARFRTTGAAYARLGAAVIHYEGDQIED
jgi:hypothetical protein